MTECRSHQLVQDSWFQFEDHMKKKNEYSEKCSPSTSTSSIGEESTVSNGSSAASSDMADDASSSVSSSNSGGALYDLSEIMAQLPIKRGLSKFYQGQSESFTSLSRVTSIEDLAKKTTPYRRNLKASKSCGNGLSTCKPYPLPKPTISKKITKGSSLSAFPSKRGSFMKPPLTALHKNLECGSSCLR